MRINNRRNYELSELCPPDDPKFNAERLGKHVEFLPPCLDPDAKKEDRERIPKQYFYNDTPQEIQGGKLTNSNIADFYPIMVDFYPTPETVQKLIKRAMQIKDPDADLWLGFNKIIHEDGCHAWIHDRLFKTNLKDSTEVMNELKKAITKSYELHK